MDCQPYSSGPRHAMPKACDAQGLRCPRQCEALTGLTGPWCPRGLTGLTGAGIYKIHTYALLMYIYISYILYKQTIKSIHNSIIQQVMSPVDATL